MSTLFSGINLALRALMAQQKNIEIIEHNVANANTPGYRRQKAILAADLAYPSPGLHQMLSGGQLGSGVRVERIHRFNLEFFDGRYRREVAESSRWDLHHSVLRQVEATLAETTSNGLLPKMDAFWAGWQALSADPTSSALRNDLYEKSTALAQAFNTRALQLHRIQEDQDLAVEQRVQEINTLAGQVAHLNVEISKVISSAGEPNDLLDQRDRLLDRLAEVAGATSSLQQNGEVIVSLEGHALVVGNSAFSLEITPKTGNPNLADIRWSDGQAFAAASGELCGLLEARDSVIPAQLSGLDQLASLLASRVNAVHSAGFGLNDATGLDFFLASDGAPINALNLSVNSALSNTDNIASAAAAGSPGDGSVAAQLGQIKHELLVNDDPATPGEIDGTDTLNGFFNSRVATLALAVQRAGQNAGDRQLIAGALDQQREAVSGVSLDEEAANLATAQRSYQAAARMLTAIDEMLDRVINGMGIVGR
jgi:flagellar hook-associated protein 1 FlgK